jgi:hypothetical protein
MATGGDLVARLRELLQDPAGAGAHWSDAFLQGCIERGNDALYPMVYEAKTDTSLTTVAGQLEYSLPSGIPTDVGFSPLRQVYLAPAAGSAAAPEALEGWRVDEGRRKLVLPWAQPAGRSLHLVYMGRLNKLNDAADSFEGSSAAETAVVAWAYAEALATERRTSLRDRTHLEAVREVREDEWALWRSLVGPGRSVWMQPIPLVR